MDWFVVQWFPSDDLGFAGPSQRDFFFGYGLKYFGLGSVYYHY